MTSRSSSSGSSTSSTTSVMDQDKINVARSLIDALNAHDLSRADRNFADSYTGEAPGLPGPMKKSQLREYNQGFLTAFPDLHFEIQRTIVQGDLVAIHWTATGTHTGVLVSPDGKSLQPTNRRARVSGVGIVELKQNKIVRDWVYWDMSTLLSQLGAMPPI